jgi:putative transposase
LATERKKLLKPLLPEEIDLVLFLRKNYKVGSTFLEKMLKEQGMSLPHNQIQKILNAYGYAKPLKKKIRRRDWVRYERKHANTMWHTDWTKLGERWLISYEDDASRFITGYGLFDAATTENSLKVLRGAIAAYGKPKSILTGRDVQFYSSEKGDRAAGKTDFQKFLEANDIQHILGRVNHPQTNGKVERFFGTVKQKIDEFDGIDELMHWYNFIKPHMSLGNNGLETPAQAFERKMHYKVKNSKREVVIVEVSK